MPEIPIEPIEGMKLQALDNYNEFTLLDNFYKRYNKVLLDKVAIDRQKQKLDNENMFIKNLLRQYLDGVSVNNDVMNNPNPLFIVNNKINLNRPVVARQDPMKITKQEGNFVVDNIAMQRKY